MAAPSEGTKFDMLVSVFTPVGYDAVYLTNSNKRDCMLASVEKFFHNSVNRSVISQGKLGFWRRDPPMIGRWTDPWLS